MPDIAAIRVATDLSSDSEPAVWRAAMIGREQGINHGLLIHALGMGRFNSLRELFSGGERLESELEENARREMEALAERVREKTGFEYALEIRKGSAVDAILDVNDRLDLVVTGARGHSSVSDVTFGSVSERVVRGSNNPVLVVRNEAQQAYRNVVVSVDFSAHSRSALLYARSLAPRARLHLVHAYPEMPSSGRTFPGITTDDVKRFSREVEELSRKELDSLLGECQMRDQDMDVVMEHAYPPQLIWETAEKVGAELVVMGKQGHSRLHEWMVGSVTAHVLPRCQADIMVVRDSRNR